MRSARQPEHVVVETLSRELRLRTPYRGIETGKDTLRLRVTVVPARRARPTEVVIDVDDLAIEVSGDQGFVLGAGAIDALFVVERQPRCGFLTWFGVFARRQGRADRLVFETNESRVAQFVERAIEDWLGLDPEPIRGELRLH